MRIEASRGAFTCAAMLTYVLVLLYCTSKLECWREEPYPTLAFASAGECRAAVEARARALLQPHFEQDHLNVQVGCEQRSLVAGAPAPESGSSAAPAEEQRPGER